MTNSEKYALSLLPIEEVINVCFVDYRIPKQSIDRKIGEAHFIIHDVRGNEGYRLINPDDLMTGREPFFAINAIRIKKCHEWVSEILPTVDWTQYLTQCSGNQRHLYPKQVYQAVADKIKDEAHRIPPTAP